VHRNARLTPAGRLTLCARIEAGRPLTHVAAEMGVSRPTAYKWWRRLAEEGPAGLEDRSSRPLRSPRRTSAEVEAAIEELRRTAKLGPARLGARLGVPPATVHRVLVRLGLSRLAWLDRPTGRVIRRYERDRPGELVHVDVKKLGRIPAGGGWRALGRAGSNTWAKRQRRIGFAYVHSAVDDHSRLAYSEVLGDERKDTCAAFWARAEAFFAEHGVVVGEVLTDNAWAYRSHAFGAALGTTTHRRTRPYRPQTNGKVERFNRTLLDEWAYVRAYPDEVTRTEALAAWLHLYNHHRSHTALGGQPPVSRVNDLPGHYS
jgi:transposase InsO family protein